MNNQLTLGDKTYDISNGAFIDLGETEGLYQGSFGLADATISANTSSFSVGSSASIRVIFNLASVGTGSLKEGSYSEGDVLGPDAGKVYFVAQIIADGTSYTASGGTIDLRGSSPNFTVNFNLQLSGGKTLTGGFQGAFATN